MPFEANRIGRHVTLQSGVRTGTPMLTTEQVEAVVIKTYYPSEDDRIDGQTSITCDVRTVGRTPRFLSRVPVFQAQAGLFDEDVWVPRESTQNINGGALQVELDPSTHPTPAESMDGDHVLVGFLEGSIAQPYISPICIPHPKARTPAPKSAGRRRRIRHHGSLIEIDSDANVTIDGREAAKESLGANGTEVSNSGVGGKVLLITKDGSAAVTSVELDASGGITITGPGGSVAIPKTGMVAVQALAKHTTTAPIHVIAGSASVSVDSPNIVMCPTASLATLATLVQHTGLNGWAPKWVTFLGVLQTAMDTIDSSKPLPPTPADIAALLPVLQTLWAALQTLGNGFALATTIATKAG